MSYHCLDKETTNDLISCLLNGNIKNTLSLMKSLKDLNSVEALLQCLDKCDGNPKTLLNVFFGNIKKITQINLNLNQKFHFKFKIIDENKKEKITYSEPIIIEPEEISLFSINSEYDNNIEFIIEQKNDYSCSKDNYKISYNKREN